MSSIGSAGGASMSILSLGASRTGLPFHVHGETWLGLVFGKKRWFLCRNYANMTEGQFAARKLALGGEATGFGTSPLLIDDDDG